MNYVTLGLAAVAIFAAAFFVGVAAPVGDESVDCREAALLGGEGMLVGIENTDTALAMAQAALEQDYFSIDSMLTDLESGNNELGGIVDDYVEAARACGVEPGLEQV